MMNRIYIILILALTFVACEESLMNFEAENNSVYFGEERDLIMKSFLTTTEDEMFLDIKINISGQASNKDREFVFIIDEDSSTATAGVDYELLSNSFVVPAGEYSASVSFRIINNEALKDGSKYLHLSLGENKNFIPGIVTKRNLTIEINDFLSEPSYWPTDFFGYYDIAKYEVFFLLSGLDEFPVAEEFQRDPVQHENYYYWRYVFSGAMKIYFIENEVYDSNGVRIVM